MNDAHPDCFPDPHTDPAPKRAAVTVGCILVAAVLVAVAAWLR